MKIDHIDFVRKYWDDEASQYSIHHPEFLEFSAHPSWGLWHLAEADIRLTNGYGVEGSHIVDLGCGQGHDALGFANLGAKVTAIDVSGRQLSFAPQHKNIRYICTSAELALQELTGIDIIYSDHGAFDHSPPEMLLALCHKSLRPNGLLIICTYTPLMYVCFDPIEQRLSLNLISAYPKNAIYFDGSIPAPQYSYAGWVSAIRNNGFAIERLEEFLMPVSISNQFSELASSDWASRWPCDFAWCLRKV